ncbi:MAG: putative ABC transporter permease [Ruminococcus sp.]|nr:putative ABC transporter permease [Ruminococcus sp.]
MSIRTEYFKLLTIFIVGGFSYGLIEVLARGYTHISMGILGGAAMCLIHLLNIEKRTPARLFLLFSVSSLFIMLCELVTGEIVNKQLGLAVWDYSMMPLNYDGQICLSFSLIWFALSAVGVWLDDFLRLKIFNESRRVMWLTDKSKEKENEKAIVH